MHASGMVLLAAAQGGAQDVPARAQMATTLGFHIILACFGIALPSIVLLAEFIGLRRGNQTAMRLARRWSQVMGVLVAVGAVTGTVLSFEMGLLWPGLMRQYGAVLGVPFGVEGLFFFLEAIFAGIYLWGWRRLPGWAHWWSGVPIAVSGIFGAISVIAGRTKHTGRRRAWRRRGHLGLGRGPVPGGAASYRGDADQCRRYGGDVRGPGRRGHRSCHPGRPLLRPAVRAARAPDARRR